MGIFNVQHCSVSLQLLFRRCELYRRPLRPRFRRGHDGVRCKVCVGHDQVSFSMDGVLVCPSRKGTRIEIRGSWSNRVKARRVKVVGRQRALGHRPILVLQFIMQKLTVNLAYTQVHAKSHENNSFHGREVQSNGYYTMRPSPLPSDLLCTMYVLRHCCGLDQCTVSGQGP